MHATLHPLMTAPADITFETRGRRTILLVECKFSPDDSAAAAAELRDRLVTDYLDVPSDSFFLLLLGSTFHLWKPGAASDAQPDGSADAMPVLDTYLGSVPGQSPWSERESVKLAVSGWLWDVAGARRGPEKSAADQMLSDFGLPALMKGGDTRLDTDP